MKSITLGSLFDGSGGFPLAGTHAGMTPVWATEIEPYPIAVSSLHFPQMKHLGDVSQIDGETITPVDIITFGSPCQDMSIAGKRKGIKHKDKGDDETTRSGLFYEAIRIIKEMREATNGEYPTFAIWENVPGAFSSNKGEDFHCVLQEFVHVCDEKLSVPRPADGKWRNAGEIVGDNFSIAWRLFDAQYWGVPQRRKRIYLVADFAGERAGKILFEREGLRGHPAPGRATGQGVAADAPGSTGGSRGIKCLNPWDCQSKRIYQPEGVYPTLTAMDGGGANNPAIMYALDSMSSNSMKSSNPRSGFHEETVAKTLQAGGVAPTCNQGGNVIVEPVYALQGNGIDRADTAGCNGRGWREDVCYTLNTIDRPAICFKAGQGAKARSLGESETVTPTLGSEAGGNSVPAVCYPKVFHTLTALNAGNVESAQQPNCFCYPQVARTLTAEADASPCIDRGQNVVCYDARWNGNGTHCPTLTGDHENRVTDYTAICVMAHGQSNAEIMQNLCPTLNCNHEQPIAAYGGKPPRKYIIRRLTPLECCRLQGFPDGWGDLPEKENMTDEEFAFWQAVRDTYARINSKATKSYTPSALLKWYNKLHTDSAEYKMWGNGIALPCAKFIMEGIAELCKED